MFKKVLAVALFAALLLSMIPAVSAADEEIVKPSKLAIVGLGNFGDADVAIAPHGGYIGTMIPVRLADANEDSNQLTITGSYENVIDKTFTLALVFDGVLVPGEDFVAVNYSYLTLKEDTNFTLLEDGRSVVWVNFKVQNWTRVLQIENDAGSSLDYLIRVQLADGTSFTQEFTVKYIDKAYDPQELMVSYSADMLNMLNILNSYPAKPNVLPKPAVVEGDLYVVTASVLNVRASAAGKIIDQVANGTVVKVVEVVGNWAKIVDEDGEYGFVYTKYIKAQ